MRPIQNTPIISIVDVDTILMSAFIWDQIISVKIALLVFVTMCPICDSTIVKCHS